MTNTLIQSLSVLIFGSAKVGKTTAGATAPHPALILDAEGGTKFLPGRIVGWDPNTHAPPIADGTWDICIAHVTNWRTVQRAYEWLTQSQHPFKSLTIDSITEIQRRCKANMISGDDQMKIQDWGVLLTRMDTVIRGFRDLANMPEQPIQVVVFIAETHNRDGKWRPYMQGAIAGSLPYLVDISGYIYAQPLVGTDGSETGIIRRLFITPHPQYETGERVQGRLPGVIDNPNITDMFNTVYQLNGNVTSTREDNAT